LTHLNGIHKGEVEKKHVMSLENRTDLIATFTNKEPRLTEV